jgi:uncharacterized protein involved in exopolysaccharide biosynthesis
MENVGKAGEEARGLAYAVSACSRILEIIVPERMKIAWMTATPTVVVAAFLFLSSGSFTATTSFLPDVQGLENLQKRSLLGELAAATGISIGLNPSQLYPEIIKSDLLLGRVMGRTFNIQQGDRGLLLKDIWELESDDTSKQYENTLKKLRNSIDVSLDRRTLIVTLKVTSISPVLSAQLANAIASELDAFALEFSKGLAGQKRVWIEKRLAEVMVDLGRAEDSLKGFRERNRSIANSPELLLAQARLAREVEINSTIFIELKKQLELARVEEARTSSIVNMLDRARPPYARSGLGRRYTLLLFAFLFLVLSTVYVYLSYQFRTNSTLRSQFAQLRDAAGGGRRAARASQ